MTNAYSHFDTLKSACHVYNNFYLCRSQIKLVLKNPGQALGLFMKQSDEESALQISR